MYFKDSGSYKHPFRVELIPIIDNTYHILEYLQKCIED